MCVRWGVQKCSFWVSQNTLFWVIMGTPNHHFWVSLLTPYMVLSPVNMVSKTDHELIIYDTWSCHQIWGFWAIPGDQVFRALSGVPPKTSKNMVLSPETTETLFDGFGQNSIVDWSYMTHDHVSYMINPWSLLEQLLTPYMVLSPVIWCPKRCPESDPKSSLFDHFWSTFWTPSGHPIWWYWHNTYSIRHWILR